MIKGSSSHTNFYDAEFIDVYILSFPLSLATTHWSTSQPAESHYQPRYVLAICT